MLILNPWVTLPVTPFHAVMGHLFLIFVSILLTVGFPPISSMQDFTSHLVVTKFPL